MGDKAYKSFKAFYPFYLSQHENKVCRIFHYIGSTLSLLLIGLAIFNADLWYVFYALVAGYGCAWIGHFFFEKNRPATFTYPLYSFIGDWKMYFSLFRRDSK